MYFNNPCALLFQFSIRLLKEIYSGGQLEVYSFIFTDNILSNNATSIATNIFK